MIRSHLLPAFVFIDQAGEERRLDLASSGSYVVAASSLFRSRLSPGSIVGLVAKSGPELVLNWLASVHAGLRPLIIQYPTEKQSRQYWSDSVKNIIATAAVDMLVCDARVAGIVAQAPELGATLLISQSEIDAELTAEGDAPEPFEIADYAIVQLSSGTTGHRKAVEFTSEAIARHAEDYNKTLDLTAGRDVVVSWLPLYHDMGYVACFVMPMLLGIPVVMMDPITWVAEPQKLFDAIARHRGTICYMPNFGFEVMSRAAPTDLSSMRWWVSCSEPVSPSTARKFIGHVGCAESVFAPCYAMAENIFAVAILRGISTCEIDGVETISCGPAIEGVELKIVDGEIMVRSPASITAYMGGQTIADESGFYPTGDLGVLREGELFVAGRKQDLIIQAGRKFMLSDIDLHLNKLYPEVRGRGAAVQVYDERLGTSRAQVLIEAQNFFLRTDALEIAAALRRETSIDQLEVEFVPPRFLTKTSSGKFNRKKSAADWLLTKKTRESRTNTPAEMIGELHAAFPNMDWARPVGTILDSLSLTVLRILLSEAGLAYDANQSLSDYEARLKPGIAADQPVEEETIHIVSLADRASTSKFITEADLETMSARLGKRVTLEHICLPPSPVLLSDIIFFDYFAPRLDAEPLKAVARAMERLKTASLILVDDVAEMIFPPTQIYNVLSHNLQRDDRADLVAVRWQRYAQFNHLLPMTVVSGVDLPLKFRSDSLKRIESYLGVPLFKIVATDRFGSMTDNWDMTRNPVTPSGFAPGEITSGILAWLERTGKDLKPRKGLQSQTIVSDDLGHFCSHYAIRSSVETAISRFSSFCIVGQESSVPFIVKEITAQGKRYVRAPSFASEVLRKVDQSFDVTLVCGPQGKYEITRPTIAIMRVDPAWSTKHVTDDAVNDLRYTIVPRNGPTSGRDWFFFEEFDRATDVKLISAARLAGRQIARNKRIAQVRRQKARDAKMRI